MEARRQTDKEEYEAARQAALKAFEDEWDSTKIEDYLMTNYRPPLSRDDIKSSLNIIRMRKNENPSLVVERLAYGVRMARDTIQLMNDSGVEENKMLKFNKNKLLKFCKYFKIFLIEYANQCPRIIYLKFFQV